MKFSLPAFATWVILASGGASVRSKDRVQDVLSEGAALGCSPLKVPRLDRLTESFADKMPPRQIRCKSNNPWAFYGTFAIQEQKIRHVIYMIPMNHNHSYLTYYFCTFLGRKK